MITVAAAVIAYLIGSISFAVVVSRVMGLDDPRTYGSGNPGATNVLRSGSKAAAILTLVGDAFKGWVAVWLAQVYAYRLGLGETTIAVVALAVFLGHLYPVFFRFKGGKGVATALGVLVGLQPWLGVATLATWLIVALFFRYSSLAAIVAAVFAPVYYVFGHGVAWTADSRIGTAIGLMALMLLYRHRQNISKLMAGKESKLGKRSPPPTR
ncbi:MAG: glycerol-3-phosphate acyltransferase [Bordetella sp. SCN 67-23]|nr:glycerol-3-phosphate 1-O-acyltransferase PlsY [Burkholderiales bacterium]ODS72517.1 MAG: glycerol-3-phosphate acyltransferase [Bordetella sp. SCN 67-23]ODU95430.1 MAG: glycerol-3-phosphate acyltransferase [Bordetella sp. SCN 68-11]OJW87505.1 MAG: glycerol-3-phosphate acyltransferase [Burkholderiales bacterium 67-32]